MLHIIINHKTIEVKKIGSNYFYTGSQGNKVRVDVKNVKGIKPKKEKYNPFLDLSINWVGLCDHLVKL